MKKLQAQSMGEIIAICAMVVLVVGAFMWGMPTYNVWHQGMAGKAKLAEANYSRQTMITQAKAKEEAAKYNAKAEIITAGGLAKAAQIVGDKLKSNEDYLMYLYIQNLEDSKNQIIYIPTEGGMPILEASRLKRNH